MSKFGGKFIPQRFGRDADLDGMLERLSGKQRWKRQSGDGESIREMRDRIVALEGRVDHTLRALEKLIQRQTILEEKMSDLGSLLDTKMKEMKDDINRLKSSHF